MPYFESKDRTVFSPVDERLQTIYNWLEKHHKTIGGSTLFDEIADELERLDQELSKKEGEPK
ncbi:hypothetical protein LC048_13755 [Mesobacillus subterraneus]|uniref:hypothetical protein n=1 Tax=Mesobacillus subterraneus TaxID=285983 RepID=UPI001CFEDCEB|nr:hypothetical protein [Mesobacillus subterraneus]WLR53588.1 hypothetical protein LC048_13755 [Mesobacillus subterraneus]